MLESALGIFAASVVAGTFGAMLGLGGGVIIIPALTIIFGVPIKEAIAASLVSVVATSTSAAVVYVEKHLTNIRLGMLLEVATTTGALAGGILAVLMSPRSLRVLFAVLLIYTAYNMIRKSSGERGGEEESYIELPADAAPAEHDEHAGTGRTPYTITHVPAGMAASFAAGTVSGLLGVGGGIIKMPVMRLVMGVPMRVAIATSNFMIGVTAATSALVYFSRGLIDLVVTAPAALGVLLGAQLGTRIVRRVDTRVLTWLLVVVMAFTAVDMLLRAWRGGG